MLIIVVCGEEKEILASHYNLTSFWCEQLNPEMIFTGLGSELG